MGKFKIFVVLLVSWLASFLAFDGLWKHPSEILVNTGGDAIKNYYTPIWYALHDSGGHFTGMHYPYGDNYVFADAQPALASAAQWYHTHIRQLDEYDVLLVLNLAMVLGISLGVLVLYLILRECNLPWLYALLVAVLISLLSPQLMRIGAHYGLSYVFAIPLVWLLSHYAVTRKHYMLWVLLLAVTLGVLQLLHVYYLLICGLFVAMYACVGFITNLKQWKKYGIRAIGLILAVAVPYLLFQYWIGQVSPADDRVAIPYGIEAYKANFNSVFFPSYMPYLSGKRADWEGMSYLGFLGLPMLVFLLYKLAGKVVGLRFYSILKPVLPTPLQTALWPAVFSFFFAIGMPMLWLLEKDLMPEGVRQFRSLGRFAWVFYYVFTVFGAFTLYQFYRYLSIKGVKKVAIFLMILALGYWAYEVQLYLRPQQKRLAERYKDKNAEKLFSGGNIYQAFIDAGIPPSSFQAILPLPFYHGGSEKITAHVNDDVVYHSIRASFQLGLPMVSSNMARTPITSTAHILQLFSSPLIYRHYPNDLGSNHKPFLVSCKNVKLKGQEQVIFDKAKFLLKVGDVSYYSLGVQDLVPAQEDAIAKYNEVKDSLIQVSNLQVSKPGYYYENTFDTQDNHLGMHGSGCLVSVNDTIWIAKDMELPASDDTLEVVFWVVISPKYHAMGEVFGTYTNDSLLQNIYIQPTNYKDIDEMWMRVSIPLLPTQMPSKLNLMLKGKYLAVDQLLIKPLDAEVYKPTEYGDTMLYNNYYVYPLKDAEQNN